MHKIISFISVVALCTLSLPGQARDDIGDYDISAVMQTEQAKEKLAGIQYFFGNQPHGATAKKYGVYSTSQKTNAFGKSDRDACEWAFISAMLRLKSRAQQLGANAIINIKSNYRDNLTSSDTSFKCGAGAIMAGVALQGEMVTIK